MRPFFAFRTKKTFHTGVRTGCHYLISLSVCLSVSVSVCVTLVVLTDCKSCTRPISKNPGSMEAGEYGLTCVTCFLACRLELDAVAGLLWIWWWVLGGAEFISVFFFPDFFFFERIRPAASMRPPCLISLSTSNEARPRERSNRGRFLPIGKKASSYRGAYRVPLFH